MADRIGVLRNKVINALDGVEIKGRSGNEIRRALLDHLSPLNVIANIGWIAHAGKTWKGEFQVQFNISGNGWSSRWPEWAFASARDALLHNKKILVISEGVPYGASLLLVLVMSESI
jgi:hypothetical protein